MRQTPFLLVTGSWRDGKAAGGSVSFLMLFLSGTKNVIQPLNMANHELRVSSLCGVGDTQRT